MDSSPFRLVQLNSECSIDFQCGDSDLDGFFKEDWFPHYNQLLAVTYCMYHGDRIVAMVSLHNDKIEAKEMGTGYRAIPNRKRMRSYPAVKVGRFAVAKDFQRQGIGEQLMDFLKVFFIIRNKTGCRAITLDAYPKVSAFYERCGFKPMKLLDSKWKKLYWRLWTVGRRWNILKKEPQNILMYFDLYKTAEVLKKDTDRRTHYLEQIREMMA